jgi:hypothetical protein
LLFVRRRHHHHQQQQNPIMLLLLLLLLHRIVVVVVVLVVVCYVVVVGAGCPCHCGFVTCCRWWCSWFLVRNATNKENIKKTNNNKNKSKQQ